jgi:hypothetical protein
MKAASVTTLEESHDPGGQEAGGEIHEHPRHALADRRRRRAEDAVLLREAREVIHVLGGLLGDDVDHVVHRDDAQHAVVDVHHRRGEQVVAAHDVGHLLLVGLGPHRHGLADHELAHRASRRRCHESANRDHAAQGAVFVHDVEVEDRLVAVADRPDRIDGLLGRHLLVEGDEVGGHHPAGARFRVELGLVKLVQTVGGQAPEHLLAALLGQPLHQLEQVVDLQAAEYVREALVRDRVEDLGKHLVGQLAQHPGGAALAEQQLDHRARLVGGEIGEKRRHVRRRHLRQQTLGARQHAAGKQTAQRSRCEFRRRHRRDPASATGTPLRRGKIQAAELRLG